MGEDPALNLPDSGRPEAFARVRGGAVVEGKFGANQAADGPEMGEAAYAAAAPTGVDGVEFEREVGMGETDVIGEKAFAAEGPLEGAEAKAGVEAEGFG